MARLPVPGGDSGNWGAILNAYLSRAHNDDGSLKGSEVAAAGAELTANKGQANGYTPLDAQGFVPSTNVPPITNNNIAANAAIDQSKVANLQTALNSKIDLSIIPAKGAVLVGGGAGQVTTIPVGTDGNALVADAASAGGLKWSTALDGTAVHKGDVQINVNDYGAAANGVRLTGAVASSGSAIVTVAGASFAAGDVGKVAVVFSDTAAGTITTIQSVQSATQITLAAAAGITTTSTTGLLVYGTDNTTAIQNALNTAAANLNIVASFVTDPNEPMGTGMAVTTLPAGTKQALYIITSQITIPSGVLFDASGMLFNALADRFQPCVLVKEYSTVRRLAVDACFGTGIQVGTTSNQQAHIRLGDIRVWHVGTNVESTGLLRSQDGVALLGYHFEAESFFIKGGNRGIYHNAGSDCEVNFAYTIGCNTGVHMNKSNQVHYSSALIDTCKGVGAPYGGVVIDNACSNIYVNAQAFQVVGTSNSCDPVIAIGQINSGVNKDITVDVQANNTGGTVLAIANAQDVTVRLMASNAVFASGITNPITTAVAYGSNLLGTIQIDGNLSSGITPFTGTSSGTYRYSQNGTLFTAVPFTASSTFLVKPTSNTTSALQVQNNTGVTIFDVDTANNRVGINTGSPDQALTINNGNMALRMGAPGSLAATPSASGGTLASGTYFYVAVAVDGAGGTTIASNEVSAAVTGPTGSVALTWNAVAGAASYRIYRGTSAGGENTFYTSGTNSFTDTGAAGTNGTVGSPTAAAAKVSSASNSWFTGGNVGIGTAAPTATLTLGGSYAINRRTVADTNYTAVATDYMIAYTSLSTTRTVTLPAASASNANQVYIIKDQTGTAGTNNIVVATSSSQLIDGAATKTINANWGFVKLYTNGSNWFTTG